MSDEEAKESKGFQVRDRRRFTETGESREDLPGEPEARPSGETIGGGSALRAPTEDERPAAEITLSTFLMSLSTQALMFLGEIDNPITGKSEVDFPAVRELIDIIAMLRDKTRGNLDAAEQRLIEKILFDLRMRYVEKTRA